MWARYNADIDCFPRQIELLEVEQSDEQQKIIRENLVEHFEVEHQSVVIFQNVFLQKVALITSSFLKINTQHPANMNVKPGFDNLVLPALSFNVWEYFKLLLPFLSYYLSCGCQRNYNCKKNQRNCTDQPLFLGRTKKQQLEREKVEILKQRVVTDQPRFLR